MVWITRWRINYTVHDRSSIWVCKQRTQQQKKASTHTKIREKKANKRTNKYLRAYCAYCTHNTHTKRYDTMCQKWKTLKNKFSVKYHKLQSTRVKSFRTTAREWEWERWRVSAYQLLANRKATWICMIWSFEQLMLILMLLLLQSLPQHNFSQRQMKLNDLIRARGIVAVAPTSRLKFMFAKFF